METSVKKHLTSIVAAALATIALSSAPAPAKSPTDKKLGSFSSAMEPAKSMGAVPNANRSPVTKQLDSKPGPAWRTVGGTVKHIKGNTYTVEDYEGNQIQLYVGQGTKQIRGNKKIGDPVRAEITRGGFANSIQ